MPLGACERRVGPAAFKQTGVVMPAPLPPYGLAAYSLVSRSPFLHAQYVMDVASVCLLVVAALVLGRVTGAGAALALFAAAPFAFIVLLVGQPLLFLFCALSASAYFLSRGQDRLAALCGCPMMLEPHLGVAVWASMFVWRPRTRIVLLAGAGALAAASVAALSWREVAEYFTTVLPLHALSEARAPQQVSLTILLVSLGVPVAAALTLSSLQYIVTATIGVITAGSVLKILKEPEAIVLIPPLFSVLGGTYIHSTDFLFAVPAALVILRHTRRRWVVCAALVALVPHLREIGGIVTVMLSATCAAFLLVSIGKPLSGGIVGLALVLVGVMSSNAVAQGPSVVLPAADERAFAEESWMRFVDVIPTYWTDALSRIAAWAALILLCHIAIGIQRRGEAHRQPSRAESL